MIDVSPAGKGKDYIDIYQGRSGIGKIQPVSEIKVQLNESMIRGKIYKNQIAAETPSKLDIALINASRGSN